MKRKFKVGLTFELLILFIISLIITILGFETLFYSLSISATKINKWLFPSKYKDSVILENYKKTGLSTHIDSFVKENLNDIKIPHNMNVKLKKSFPYYFNGKTIIYIVNSKGEILSSNIEETLCNIRISELKDSLEIKKYDTDMVRVTEVKKVNEDLYVVIIHDGTVIGDILLLCIETVMFMIIFFFLVKGRLKYIIHIEKGIKKIYSSGFKEKIPLKYNNELTSLAISINYMAEKIKKSDEEEKDLLLNISHDLRTPLTSILGFLKLIKQKKYDNEEEKERYINIVEEKSIYLKNLIEQFFDFSKLKWQNVELNKENIKLQELIRQIIDGFYPQLKQKQITISMNFSEKSLYNEVDIDKFTRAIENILYNAIKYSAPNTEINVNLYKDINIIIIEFWNTPEEKVQENQAELLLNRFYKGDSSRTSSGSGLGLAISLEIIKLHNGTLEVILKDSQLGIIIKL